MANETEKRIDNYWERFGVWAAGLLIAIAVWQHMETRARLEVMDAQIEALQSEKASRKELMEMEGRFYKRFDELKSDVNSGFDRMERYFLQIPKK